MYVCCSVILRRAAKKLSHFLFSNWFSDMFFALFSVVFLHVGRYFFYARMEVFRSVICSQ